jgi:hypothetical protein
VECSILHKRSERIISEVGKAWSSVVAIELAGNKLKGQGQGPSRRENFPRTGVREKWSPFFPSLLFLRNRSAWLDYSAFGLLYSYPRAGR